MSDWNLVQIYCDEMGGIDENDLIIEVKGNKEERENLISHLLQRTKSKYKDGGGVGKDKVFEVAYYGKKHLKQRGSSKGNYKTWVVATNREEAIEKVKNDDDEFAELKSAKPTNLDVERYKFKTGGMVVTSIKDIPNFKKRLDEGKITYRGLGMGKLSDDFYDLAGETGSRIKVDGKEYFITNTEFDTFNRGKDGLMRIRFAAPYRKDYSNGGGIGENKIDFKNFTIAEFNSFVKSINNYGDIQVSVSVGNNVNKEGTYTKKIDLKKLKDLSMSLGDGKEISVITGSENIYADVVVYDNNYDKGYKEYTISLFSKDDKKGLKSIVNAIIEKFKNGGGIDINDWDMPVIRTQFRDEEYEFKDGGSVGVDLFEDNNKQPIKVRKILSKYELEDGMDYRVLSKMQKELESIGYTFDYYLDGVPYDLRKIGQKGKLELEQENDDYANGGATKGFCYTIGGL